MTPRRRLSRVLTALTAVLAVAALLAAYADRAFIDANQFSDRASAALRDESVRTLLGERITDRLVLANEPDLLAARPLITSAVSGTVGGPAFGSLFRRAVRDVHRAVLDRDQDTLTLTIADVGTVVGAALEHLRPELAAKVERTQRATVLEARAGPVAGDLARLADRIRLLGWLLPLLTVASAAGAVLVSPRRRATVSALGIALVVAGVVVVGAVAITRAVVLGHVDDPDTRAATAAVWERFFGDLRLWGWVLAGAGAVIAAAAASVLRPIAVSDRLRAAGRPVVTEPDAVGWRLVRALAFVGAGLLVVIQPATAVQVAATVVGVFLVFVGVEAILRLITPEAAAEPPVPVTARLGRAAARARVLVAPAVGLAIIALAVVAVAAGGGTSEPATPVVGRCEGHAALCDRPLDELTLAATHNAMSVPLPGWYAAEQDRPIPDQLDDGVRGLLLDTHYADKLPNGRIRTVFESPADIERAIKQDGVSEQAAAAAKRLRERLGFRGTGERGVYLCHTFCELGATPLPEVLDELHTFLVTHPSEVVVIVNQDAVTPKDIVAAFDRAGLSQYAFTPPAPGERWPTLRDMIESGRRLVVLAENDAGAAPWYQLAYKRLTEETPYTFTSARALTDPAGLAATCRANRGPEHAPLFLINHWVSTDPVPRPSDAAKVNAYKPLLARAQECRRVRGHLPTLLAVNFYLQGDVFKVVDHLNGVGSG